MRWAGGLVRVRFSTQTRQGRSFFQTRAANRPHDFARPAIMIELTCFSGRTVAVFGLGGSGIACLRSLVTGGAQVVAWDDNEVARENARSVEGVEVADLAKADWSKLDALVLAPGVPLTHPVPHWSVERARDAGVEIIGDVELFFRQRALDCPNAPIIAITGTNGKSTTTALVAHLLEALGLDVSMGGNIGPAILSLDHPSRTCVHVVELSSYQIDLTPSLSPSVGVLLNVSPDHLDRHGSMERYAAVKERLVGAAKRACVGVDDALTGAIAERLIVDRSGPDSDTVLTFTAGKGRAIVPSFYAIGRSLFMHERQGSHASSRQIATLDGIGSLRGRHNVQNALAALACIKALQDEVDTQHGRSESDRILKGAAFWDDEGLQAGLRSFPGLAHRMEEVGSLGRVLFVNDSKATNADSAAKALDAWQDGIFWIAGGQAKDGGIASLEGYYDRIEKAYLIGDAAEAFSQSLAGRVENVVCGDLKTAVARAAGDASSSTASEPVVLLSPACASFDQFANFEVRGEAFRSAVETLRSVEQAAGEVTEKRGEGHKGS